MKILSIDTSSDICGVSILEDDKLICNLDIATGRTHSENLMPLIQDAFFKSNLSIKDIDLLVCDIGPGSFTGIRIGVATVKAFADSLKIPVVGVNSLEALSYNAQNAKIVASIIDCKNDNCYFALYENKGNYFEELIEPQAESISSAKAIINSYVEDNFKNEEIIFVGRGTDLDKLNSYNLGICGFKKYQNGYDLSQEVLPLYLRKPQAQRQLEEKLKGTKNG